jgi:GH24 family phage-related lysozyme (muramidase)
MPTQLPNVGADGEIQGHGAVRDPGDIPEIYQPDMPRLARGENIEETSVVGKNISAEEEVSTANGRGWNIPRSPYNAQYPYNRVYESESGHIMEFDDTPGAERINLYHPAGSWIEIDSNGNMVISSAGDDYDITNQSKHIYVRGNYDLTVRGASNVYVQGNAHMKVDGNYTTDVHGDYTLNVSGKYILNTLEGLNFRAANLLFEAQSENIEIISANEIINKAAANYSIKSGLDTYINSGTSIHALSGESIFLNSTTNMHLNSGENVYSVAAAEIHVKANGNLYVESAAESNFKSAVNTNVSSGGSTHVKSASNINLNSAGVTAVKASQVHLNSGGYGSANEAGSAEDAETALEGMDPTSEKLDIPSPGPRGEVRPQEPSSTPSYGLTGVDDASDTPDQGGGGAATTAAAIAAQTAAGSTGAPPGTEGTGAANASMGVLELIKSFEGFYPEAYWDYAQWSIGYGSFAGRNRSAPDIQTVTEAEATRMLEQQLQRYIQNVEGINRSGNYNWNQGQKDALISFAYNLGSINGLTADATRSNQVIADKMLEYNKAGGVAISGLTRRRQIERQKFVENTPPDRLSYTPGQ